MRFPSEAAFEAVEIQTRAGRAVHVREYTGDDFRPLVDMYKGFEPKRTAQGLPPPDVPRIEQWLNRLGQESRALLAWDGPTVAAHVLLCPISETAVEFSIFVHQDYRRIGLGTALTRLAVAFAGRCGFSEVLLTTEVSNLAALRVYRHVGFEVTGSFGDECEMKLMIAGRSASQARAA
jgi:ribosomal protein S18 acetylase RimI-like enzyme